MTRYNRYKIGLMHLGLKQKDLAQILNLSKNYLSELMHGKKHNIDFDNWMDENVLSKFSLRGRWNGK